MADKQDSTREVTGPGTPRPAALAVGPPPRVPTPAEIVRDHGSRVYNLVRRMLGSDADAEDVTQDVLLQAIQKLSTFRGESSFQTWLHSIAVNAALSYRRNRAVQQGHQSREALTTVLEGEAGETPVRPWSTTPEKAMQDRETRALLERAIARLPVAYRDVFVLADVEGTANAEIGAMLGLSVAAVKSRLHRARLMLRETLSPHFEEAAP